MPDSVRRLLEVYEVMEQMALVFKVPLSDDSIIKDLFHCAQAWSKTCWFCQQFLNLGLESVEDNSEHELAGMAD